MTLRLVYNPTDTPLVIDAEGHVLGGSEWGTVESRDDTSGTLLTGRQLIEVDEPAGVPEHELNPRFVRARKVHKDRKDKTERAAKLDKDKLRDLAEPLGVADDATKSELVEAVATSDVDIPKSGRGRTSKES